MIDLGSAMLQEVAINLGGIVERMDRANRVVRLHVVAAGCPPILVPRSSVLDIWKHPDGSTHITQVGCDESSQGLVVHGTPDEIAAAFGWDVVEGPRPPAERGGAS